MRHCVACAHFRNDPQFMEAAVAGLSSLGSGWASVADDDGLCLHWGRHAGARSSCDGFAPQPPDQGSSRIDPVTARLSMTRWASAASLRGKVLAMVGLTRP